MFNFKVNNIPSLHINTIDAYVNRPMVAKMFNILGFHIPKSIASKHQKTIEDKLKINIRVTGLVLTNYCLKIILTEY